MLKETLTTELVTVDLSGNDKPGVIRALLDLLCRTGKIKDPELALKDLLDHEAEMSTGMENGIAVPHVKTDAVDELVACVGISRRKIDFESLDRQPSRIFIMTLSPIGSSGPHARFLADIARLLGDAKTRKKILKAKTDTQLFELLTA
jgi:mannitol/fructose-specific phosphotransferase system IIA component (Ntr-type)